MPRDLPSDALLREAAARREARQVADAERERSAAEDANRLPVREAVRGRENERLAKEFCKKAAVARIRPSGGELSGGAETGTTRSPRYFHIASVGDLVVKRPLGFLGWRPVIWSSRGGYGSMTRLDRLWLDPEQVAEAMRLALLAEN